MSDVLLKATNIRKAYVMGREPLHVLRGASLEVHRGEFVAVMGASGSGKSTLLHILGALDEPDKGTVTFEGVDVFKLPTAQRERIRCVKVGFVFQFYHLLPELNVFENIMLPRMVDSPITQWAGKRRPAHEAARQAIDNVELAHRVKHRPSELSGGERQRAAIARALVNEPVLLLADEPTGNLDKRMGKGILDVLASLNERGQTIVMVTHDPDSASRAHRSVLLEEGRIRIDPK